MPFYEVLKLLVEEPGKHHFRRKSWDNDYKYNDTKFIASFAITIKNIAIVTVHKSNDTGYQFNPTFDEITAKDWIEV